MLFRKSILLVLRFVVFPGLASTAMAQLGGSRVDYPLDKPVLSPYLNMLRSGGGPGQNYFGLVVPQQQFAQQNLQLGRELQTLESRQFQGIRGLPGGYGYSQLGITGHPVIFNSFGTSQFTGGYTGSADGGFGGGGFGGGGLGIAGAGMSGGFGQFDGATSVIGGGGAPGGSFGTGRFTGHPAQFGGIGNSGSGALRGR